MRFGPTSLKVSRLLAKGLRRPKLRSDLRISEQTFGGERSYVIKVPETNSYHRYGISEYGLLALCDGTRTGAEVAATWNDNHPDDPLGEAEVKEFLDSVEPGVWERSLGEKNLAVLERIRDDRKSRVDQSSTLYITFRAWDPDRTLAKLDPYLSWMFTPAFVFVSLAIFVAAAYVVAGDWAHVQRDTLALYSFKGKTAYDLWAFWILLFVLGGVHEFGHGLTCKHFGGEVHQMGFMLIYFTPAFFTDTTDILLFDRTSRRQWVIFAGIWVEMVFCGLSAFAWAFSTPGSLFNDLAYKMMLLSGIQGALLNLNPLIKADGYYALSQFLQIDNLRESAFAFLKTWARKHVLREDVEIPSTTRRLRRIYGVFAVSALIYGVAIIVFTVLFVKNILVDKLGNWGYLVTAVAVYFVARKSVKKALPQVRAWIREKTETRMKWKFTRLQQGAVAGLAFLLLVPPVPSRVASDFVLEPGRDAHVRAEVPGIVQQLFVKEGDRVKAGQVLAVLENPDVEATAQTLAEQLAMANSNVRVAQAQADSARVGSTLSEQERLQQDWQVAQQNADALEIRAPFDGIVTSQALDQKRGEYLSAGDELCEVADRSTMKARVLVRDQDLEDTPVGARAQLKVVPLPFHTYSGRVEAVLPAASPDRPVAQPQKLERMGQQLNNYFAVVMQFPNADGSLREGMTGTARITDRYYPLAWQAARATWRWARSQIW
jgi:putative peptide zinc metalloprotease protein